MSRKPVYALVAVAVLSLAGCSADDLPFIGKPAARMDGHTVSMAEYQTRLRLLRDDYNITRQANPSQYPSLDSTDGKKIDQNFQNQAIQDLVDQQLVLDDAKNHGITVSDDDVNKDVDNARRDYEFRANQANQQGSQNPGTFNDYLKKEGVTIDQVREQARARLAEQRLENQQAKRRAQDALDMIKGGKDLVEVAKQYSDEKDADRGTELTVKISDLDTGSLAALKGALTALQVGQTTQELTKASDGFYILKLDAKDATTMKIRYVLVRAPDADFYHINQRPQWFADYVTGLEKNAHVQYQVGSIKNP
ncbi:MAG: SurA N-terminal domain-containing protein [Candidatus Dormiibacterota bacterium]